MTKAALKPLDLQQTKDIETAVAGIRADKLKEKTAADAAKKGAPPCADIACGRTSLLCRTKRVYAPLSSTTSGVLLLQIAGLHTERLAL